MDALPGIGHACGHNLIAIGGVAAALGVRAALEKHDIKGTVILLGTPGALNETFPLVVDSEKPYLTGRRVITSMQLKRAGMAK
jgi:hypothetical protein